MDLLILIAIAWFVFNQLFKILGQTDNDNKPRHNIFQYLKPKVGEPRVVDVEAEIISATEAGLSITDRESLAGIREIEPKLNLDRFLEGARKAFSMIQHAVSKQDKKTLSHLVSSELYNRLSAEIDHYNQKNNRLICNIVNILRLDIQSINLDQTTAQITVQIHTTQTKYVQNSSGQVIEGSDSRLISSHEKWTFERSLTADDKTWKLNKIES